MTVTTTSSRVSYAGNGATVAFPVPFYFLAAADLVVIRVTAAGLQTTLALGTDYTVTGAGVAAGGTVTLTTAPAAGQVVVIYRDPLATQDTDYAANDPFPAETHERALDKLTMLVQRVRDLALRSFRLSDGDTTTASTQLPVPVPSALVGWNAEATGLQNVDPTTLATIVAFGTARADTFVGNGTQTAFTLSANPGALANLDVSVGGVTQAPGTNYTWTGGQVVTFTAPVPNGVPVLIRYLQALPQGTADGAATSFQHLGVGAIPRSVQEALRERGVSVKDFGAVGNGVADDSGAFQAAITAAAALRTHVLVPGGTYVWNSTVTVTTGVCLVGLGDPPPNYWPAGFNGDFINTGVVIRYTGAGVALDVAPGSVGTRRHVWISNMAFVGGADLGQVTGTGIRFRSLDVASSITPVVLQNVTCTRFPTAGIDLDGNVFEASAFNLQCNRNGVGFRARAGNEPGELPGEWALHRSTFAFNTVGLDLAGGGNWKLYGNSTSFNTNENAIFNGVKLSIFGHSQERGGAVGMRFQSLFTPVMQNIFVNYDTATTQTGLSFESCFMGRVTGLSTNSGASNIDIAIDGGCHTLTIDKYLPESSTPRISDNGTATEINPRPMVNFSDRGDANVTLTWIDAPIQRFTVALTAARTVTLPTTGVLVRGHRFRVVRTAGGAFGLNVGGVITLNAPAGSCNWAEVMWSGGGWVLIGAGSL